MSKSCIDILFEDTLPTDALSIQAGDKYSVSVKEFFEGVFLLSKSKDAGFKFPLFYAFQDMTNTTQINPAHKVTQKEIIIYVGLVDNTNYKNAEKHARKLQSNLDTLFDNPNNNGLKFIYGSDGSSGKYYVESSAISTPGLDTQDVKAVATKKIKITINS